jgi:hypothetical protein
MGNLDLHVRILQEWSVWVTPQVCYTAFETVFGVLCGYI